MYKIKNYHYSILILFSLVLFMPGISNMPVIDRDEAHFAQASRQMVQTGHYFQIRFQDKTRFQKPPGINWLQAASVKLFSNADATNIWPYRIPSLLGALFSVLLTYFFARRFVNVQTAGIAAGLLASSLLLVVEAHMAVIDTSLLSSILLMQGSLWIIYQASIEKKTIHWRWPLCFWLAMAYGLLLKGVTPLVGLLSIVTLCIIDKQVDWLRGLRFYTGLALFVFLSVAWLVLVNEAEHSNYLLQMINKDLLPKLQGGHESHGKPPLFHLFILPVTFWPGSLFLWIAGVYAWKNRSSPLVKFLLAWLIPTWVFFECMPTKLPQYVLPVFPALAILSALAIENYRAKISPEKWLRFLQIMWGVLSISIGFFLVLMTYLIMQEVNFISLFIFAIISVFTCVTVYFARKGINRTGLISLFIMAALSYSLIFSQLLPQLKPIWLSATVARFLDKNKISDDKPLLAVGFDEPSLVFNLNTNLVTFTDKNAAIAQLTDHSPQLVLFEAHAFQSIENPPAKLSILAQISGFNYSKGRWVQLLLVRGQAKEKKDATI